MSLDRALSVLLRQVWPGWTVALVVAHAGTAVRWHRRGLRLHCRWKSRNRCDRLRIPKEARQLTGRMALENPCGARRIHAELARLGLEVSLATVSPDLARHPPHLVTRQESLTFPRNRGGAIAAMHFFALPTASFRLLHVWFALADAAFPSTS